MVKTGLTHIRIEFDVADLTTAQGELVGLSRLWGGIINDDVVAGVAIAKCPFDLGGAVTNAYA